MDPFLKEYSSVESIRSYQKETAGSGIDYVLGHVYGPLYRDYIQRLWKGGQRRSGIRILEYGCGGGMNLIYIANHLAEWGVPLEAAYGTDFSAEMIRAANAEAESYLEPRHRSRMRFLVTPNENLIEGLSSGLEQPASSLLGSFDFIVGVNTFRYCHRLKKEFGCAQSIFDLLVPGGTSVMIEMNKDFPFFRSRLRDKLTKPKEEYFLPSLEEYAQPFVQAGFRLTEQKNFCWVPHSAGGLRLTVCRSLSPLLDRVAPRYAMRSLVIGTKPE